MKRMLMYLMVPMLLVSMAVAAQERPYSEGPVVVVTSVDVLDGQFETYMAFLRDTYKPIMEAQKKAGIILDYGVYDLSARRPEDPDLYLTLTYPNMASFDGLEERIEPLMTQITKQTRAQADDASVKRGSMRKIMGSEMIRKVILK